MDGVLYRGRIIEISDNQFNILFIDFGNTEKKNKSDLFNIPSKISSIPALAFSIKIDGFDQFEDSEENRQALETMLMVENVGLTKTSHETGYLTISDKPLDSNQLIIKEKVGKVFHNVSDELLWFYLGCKENPKRGFTAGYWRNGFYLCLS